MDDPALAGPDLPSRGGAGFSDRVLGFFFAQVLTAGLGIFNGVFLARLIGPAGKGDYYLLTFLPPTLMVLTQLGLPQAFSYFAAKGSTNGLLRQTVVLSALASLPVLVVTIAMMPTLRATILHQLEPVAIIVPLLTLPLLLNATMTTGIVVGRQAARWLTLVGVCASISATAMIIVFVGGFGLGVWGALFAFVVTAAIQATGFFLGASRVTRAAIATGRPSYRNLFRYGLPFYPGTLTQFFGYRADVYLIAFLVATPSGPLGYYSVAVSMAELVFFFPNAVATFFFPRVASVSREESDRQVPFVSRVTLLLTACVGIALIPIASIAIPIVLPAFGPSLPPLYVLLPGVVLISVSKVLGGYVAGLGRTGLTSIVSIGSFVSNVVLNVLFIPRFGIVGAAAASLVSYSASSIAYSFIAAHLSGARWLSFWVPRSSDIKFVVVTTTVLFRRITQRFAQE